jgi:hypothetical protein
MMGSKAFESPLIPHARMRALYRGLVEARALTGGKLRKFEACWVAPAIDLKPGDLVSTQANAGLLDYIRALGGREAARAASRSDIAKIDKTPASRLPPIDRLLCAVGMAMATAKPSVVVAFTAADDLTPAEWKRLLTAAVPGELPLVIVATPGGSDLSDIVKRMGAKTIPVIPVDAGDVVAIYRVMQETLVRARADGGVVVVECIDCKVDPVKLMGAQLVKKKICTEKWVAGVESSFRKLLQKA